MKKKIAQLNLTAISPPSTASFLSLPHQIQHCLDSEASHYRSTAPNVVLPVAELVAAAMTPKRYIVDPQGRTNPFVWCAAIICAVLAVAVIIAGIAVFVGYIVIHPRIPSVSVASATLDTFRYDQAGLLVTQITILIQAKNDNRKAHATFLNTSFVLSFDGMEIAELVADPFDVEKNRSNYLNYVVGSSPIPLNPERMEMVSDALRRDEVVFDLKGNFRARWRIGLFGSVKYWCHLSCELLFHPANGTYSKSNHCNSISK